MSAVSEYSAQAEDGNVVDNSSREQVTASSSAFLNSNPSHTPSSTTSANTNTNAPSLIPRLDTSSVNISTSSRPNGNQNATATSATSSRRNRAQLSAPRDDESEYDEEGTLVLMSSNRPDAPPNSRLFVICAKTLQQQNVKKFFQSYGEVRQVFIIKDKESKQSRGCCFVTFSNSYSALRALEAIQNFSPQLGGKPLKARLAQDPKKAGPGETTQTSCDITSEENEKKYLSKLSKLRICIRADDTEETLRSYFSTFGTIEYVNILRCKETQKSRNVALVKFERASSAANALQNNKQKRFHPVIASNNSVVPDHDKGAMSNAEEREEEKQGGASEEVKLNKEESMMAASILGLPNRDLVVRYHKSLTDSQLFKLFDIVPGLEDIKLAENEDSSDLLCCYPKYKTPLNALYAKEKLNGFEYPIGKFITVAFDTQVRRNAAGVISVASSSNRFPQDQDTSIDSFHTGCPNMQVSGSLSSLTGEETSSEEEKWESSLLRSRPNASTKWFPLQPIADSDNAGSSGMKKVLSANVSNSD